MYASSMYIMIMCLGWTCKAALILKDLTNGKSLKSMTNIDGVWKTVCKLKDIHSMAKVTVLGNRLVHT